MLETEAKPGSVDARTSTANYGRRSLVSALKGRRDAPDFHGLSYPNPSGAYPGIRAPSLWAVGICSKLRSHGIMEDDWHREGDYEWDLGGLFTS
ncbi:hypothetical protein N7470_007928 [Penicillium chermesinum]|nr:hypothetical protein N7470_007928 [Penicillium chermesinum]